MLLCYDNRRKKAYHGYHEHQLIQNQQLAMVSI
jgi:hypothetical protein